MTSLNTGGGDTTTPTKKPIKSKIKVALNNAGNAVLLTAALGLVPVPAVSQTPVKSKTPTPDAVAQVLKKTSAPKKLEEKALSKRTKKSGKSKKNNPEIASITSSTTTQQGTSVASIAGLTSGGPVTIGVNARKISQETLEKERITALFNLLNNPEKTYPQFLVEVETIKDIVALKKMAGPLQSFVPDSFTRKTTALFFEPRYHLNEKQALEMFDQFAKTNSEAASSIFQQYFVSRNNSHSEAMKNIVEKYTIKTQVASPTLPPAMESTVPLVSVAPPTPIPAPIPVLAVPISAPVAAAPALVPVSTPTLTPIPVPTMSIPVKVAAPLGTNTATQSIKIAEYLKNLPIRPFFGVETAQQFQAIASKYTLIQSIFSMD